MPGPWRVVVCDDAQWQELRDFQAQARGGDERAPDVVAQAVARRCAERGETYFKWTVREWGVEFLWACPLCGHVWFGRLGDKAVGGWDGSQRWVNTGTEDKPTLQPSLGCANLQERSCTGHYWLRDGRLVEV